MVLFLVRYGELGLKSERVKRLFLRKMMKDIQSTLMSAGIEHTLEEERGRIYIEADDGFGASRVIRTIPGIFSFSEVKRTSSDWDILMRSLSDYGRTRLKEGMTYGLKVRRVGKEGYSSQDVAVHGGGAVSSHLSEGSVKVKLKGPDILFEVEVRGDNAYLFTDRVQGMGGLPSASQGTIVLFLPHEDPLTDTSILRAKVSLAMMKRRGCSVHAAAYEVDGPLWEDALKDPHLDIHPLRGHDELLELISTLDAKGLVHILPIDRVKEAELFVDKGRSIASFFPTAVMDHDELLIWEKRFFKGTDPDSS
ncbi:MAG: THUMP domain-containing protein [Candidatus Thermoplasmatota archaeon]|jgi:thiamine biosynthesis protein ThiI|nr:THUMP domain-containing protein [Candidatus Thermoplasmatota archaeon]